MNDTEIRRCIVGSIEVMRVEGGYGLFDVRTGKRIGWGLIFLTHPDALQAARRLDMQREAKEDW
jgi:hypothetical protein